MRAWLSAQLENFSLAYYLNEAAGVLTITTTDVADARFSTRVYRLGLLTEGPGGLAGERLIDLFEQHASQREIIESDLHFRDGAVTSHPGMLIVTDDTRVHAEVERFLVGLSRFLSSHRGDVTVDPPLPQPLRAALARRVSLEVRDEPLSGVVEQLRATSRTPILMYYRDLDDGDAWPRETKVTLRVTATLRKALDSLCAKINREYNKHRIDWMTKDGAIFLASPYRARLARIKTTFYRWPRPQHPARPKPPIENSERGVVAHVPGGVMIVAEPQRHRELIET